MTQEFTHNFKGFGRVPSTCLVRKYSDDGETFFCFIDIGEGTSVTNDSEHLASDMVNNFNLNPKDCRFFETYSQYNYDSFDEIEYSWDTLHRSSSGFIWEASAPKWKPADPKYKELFTS